MTNTSSFLALASLTLAFGAEELRIQRKPVPEELKAFSSVLKVTTVGNRVAFALADSATGKVEVWVKNPDGKLYQVKGVPSCLLQRVVEFPTILAVRFWVATDDGITIGCGGTTIATATVTNRILRTGPDWKEFVDVLAVGQQINYSSNNGDRKTSVVKVIYGGIWPGGLAFMDLQDNTSGIFRIQDDGTWKLEMPRPAILSGKDDYVDNETAILEGPDKSLYFGGQKFNLYFYYRYDTSDKSLTPHLYQGKMVNNEFIKSFGVSFMNGQPFMSYNVNGEVVSALRLLRFFTEESVFDKTRFADEYPYSFSELNGSEFIFVSAIRTSSADKTVTGLAICLDGICQKVSKDNLANAGIFNIDGKAWIDTDGTARTFTLTNGRIDGQVVFSSIIPRIRQISAAKSTAKKGEVVTLSWNAAFADAVTLNDESVPSIGTKDVPVDRTTEYILKAYGPGGIASGSATITVLKPVVAFVDGADTKTGMFFPGISIYVFGESFDPEDTVAKLVNKNGGEYPVDVILASMGGGGTSFNAHLPENAEPGDYQLVVVAGGVESDPYPISIAAVESPANAAKKAGRRPAN
jgi:hypothetical protein